MKINLGSGGQRKEGYVNIDIRSSMNPDVLCDLNRFPYPFPDNSVEVIEMTHILEHLNDPFAVMRECHRILKSKGILIIRVPHFSRGMTHPEHQHGFDITFPYYFDPIRYPAHYYGVTYILEEMRAHWVSAVTLRHLHDLNLSKTSIFMVRQINTILSWLSNLHLLFMSRIWCYWVGGFEEIEMMLRKP